MVLYLQNNTYRTGRLAPRLWILRLLDSNIDSATNQHNIILIIILIIINNKKKAKQNKTTRRHSNHDDTIYHSNKGNDTTNNQITTATKTTTTITQMVVVFAGFVVSGKWCPDGIVLRVSVLFIPSQCLVERTRNQPQCNPTRIPTTVND